MPRTMSLRTVLASCSILSLAPQTLAHMEMSWPYPLHSKFDPANSYTVIDYSMTAPLFADGSNFPCKGYQNDRPIVDKVTYQAGQTYNMTLAGSATHGGGSCQLSLSYDNGATFRVIKSMIGGCPLTSEYDFTIPSYAPDGNALFAWTWQNLQGNREYYMNCAEVDITGSTASKRDDTSFDDLPFIWKANLPGINTCATVENVLPIYPHPGPDVLYGTGASSSSAATSGVCDAATPFGQTYEYLSDTANPSTEALGSGSASTAAASSSSTTKSSISTTLATSSKAATSSSSSKSAATSTTLLTSSKSTTSSSTSRQSSTTSVLSVASPKPVASSGRSSSVSTSATSPTTLTFSSVAAGKTVTKSESTCAPDVTITVYADATGTSTKTASGFTTSKVSPSLTGSSVSTLYGFSTAKSSTVLVVSAPASSKSSKAASSTKSAAGPQVTEESYATGDLATYLPCVPGTFICTSNTTWVTCDQTMYSNGDTAWVYDASRAVGSGMACYPNVSPYSDTTEQYAQQADAPTGYYRDDRIAASEPYGSCSVDGSIQCTSGGSQFLMCDDGGLVLMGPVPDGTMCEDGSIVSSS